MIYEMVIGVGTMIFLILLWVVLMKPVSTMATTFKNMTPSVRFNETINQTMIYSQYDLAFNAMYFLLFFMVFMIFIWIVKISAQQQKSQMWGG